MSKLLKLKEILQQFDKAIVAFSGGVDSTFLLKIASEVFGKKVVAITAVSPSLSEEELSEAKALAASIGVEHRLIKSYEVDNPNYIKNPVNRCYFCKSELYNICNRIAKEEGQTVLDGVNLDDMGDHRPGRLAAKEANVRSPLLEAGFTKSEIREASRVLGLSTWDKPQLACLASRFPYGTKISPERLTRVGRAESVLRSVGLRQFRLRFHEKIARIEIEESEMGKLLKPDVRKTIINGVKSVGFDFVVLDLEPYRSGRLNELVGISAAKGA